MLLSKKQLEKERIKILNRLRGGPSNLEYRIVKDFIMALSKICYRIKTTGTEHFHIEPPYIVAGNHHSTIDALVIGLYVPHRIHFLGKQSALWQNQVWARINDYFGTIPVKDKRGSNQLAMEAGVLVLKQKRVLGIFPEGAILPKRKAFEGRTGVARFSLLTGAPVIPVGILGTEDVLPYPEYGRPAVWPRVGKKIELHVRPPLYFDEYGPHDANDKTVLREITDRIMAEIRKASRGYGCPPRFLKELIRQGILQKHDLSRSLWI